MVQAAQIVGCAGFSVCGSSGIVGWVEEVWLDEADAPAGVAVELLDERRVFLPVADIAEILPESFSVTMRPNARLLALELPRVATAGANGEALSATWRTTDEPVDLAAAPGGGSGARRPRPKAGDESGGTTTLAGHRGALHVPCPARDGADRDRLPRRVPRHRRASLLTAHTTPRQPMRGGEMKRWGQTLATLAAAAAAGFLFWFVPHFTAGRRAATGR